MSATPRTDEFVGKVWDAERLKHPVREYNDLADFARQLERALEKADRRAAELERDARRYRWLRNQIEKGPLCIFECNDFDVASWSGDDPDAAIDAALESEKGESHE